MDAYAEEISSANTGDTPLVFGDVKWDDGVLKPHTQTEEFLKRLHDRGQGVRKRVVNNSGKMRMPQGITINRK